MPGRDEIQPPPLIRRNNGGRPNVATGEQSAEQARERAHGPQTAQLVTVIKNPDGTYSPPTDFQDPEAEPTQPELDSQPMR